MISSRTGFAHNIDLSRFRHAIDDEASELSSFARSLRVRTQTRPGAFDRPIDDMKSALKAADAPAEAEGALSAANCADFGWTPQVPLQTEVIAHPQRRSLLRRQPAIRPISAMSANCSRQSWSNAVPLFSAPPPTAGRSITRWSRVVKRQWLRCCICSARSSRSVIKDH